MVSLEKIKTMLTGEEGEPSSNEQPTQTSSLYRCSVCDTVYISDEMQTCPECEDSVDQVPNERQLGLDRQ